MPVYISEVSYVGSPAADLIEIAATDGTDASACSIYLYGSDGLLDEGPISLGSIESTNAARNVYIADNSCPQSFAALGGTQSIALVDDLGNVLQFVAYEGNTTTESGGPADGLTSTDIGTTSSGQSLQSEDGGASYYVQSSFNEGTIPCYAPGTLIDTPDGVRAVETLKPGDLVMTRDSGPQAIRWIRTGDQVPERAEREARPVLIAAGALGANLPSRDLIVSPQHRMFVGGGGQLEEMFAAEAFGSAKSLTGLPGIRHMMGRKAITWVHFACDRHEVVRANGCWSESLLIGRIVLQALTERQRKRVSRQFRADLMACGASSALHGQLARPCLTVAEVRRMIAGYCRSARIAA